MSTTPTLDAERTDQLRTFLTVEAAASATSRRSALTPARRRLAVGTATALLLAGGLVAVQAVGGEAPAAIAVEVDGEWTTIRLVDIDADPDAVVQQLLDAGFDAERQVLEVERVPNGGAPTEYSVTHVDDDGATQAASMGMMQEREGGAHGVVGLTVGLPPDAFPPSAPPTAGTETETETETGTGGGALADPPAPPVQEDLEAVGVRFEADGAVSVRSGTEVTIVVTTER